MRKLCVAVLRPSTHPQQSHCLLYNAMNTRTLVSFVSAMSRTRSPKNVLHLARLAISAGHGSTTS